MSTAVPILKSTKGDSGQDGDKQLIYKQLIWMIILYHKQVKKVILKTLGWVC